MNKFVLAVAAVAVAFPVTVDAHPTNLYFPTRGACEAAQAHVNNSDRQYVAGPVFGIDNNGEAQVFFLESFQCEYDPEAQQWHMVNHMGDDSDIGNAFDH